MRTLLIWTHDDEDRWVAYRDDIAVGSVSRARVFDAASSDGFVRGSHSTLGAAQAQIEAWNLWTTQPRTA